ncbi:MAG: MATE family efflux transporter [Bacteroides sp.]|nr:MATE family efflux transporter [Bacteroides sp.]
MAASKEMTEGRCLPQIFNFALPLLLGNLLQQTYSLVDAAIVGKFLGINALASVGASTSVVFLILGFCNGCCGGFGIPVAQKFGARDYRTMRRYVSVSLQLAAVMSVVIAIVTSLLCADILHWMRTPDNIFEGAYYYLLITFIGVPCTFFYNLLSSIIRALGDSKTPFWFLLLSTVLNIVLDLFCILALGWGVAGAAIATLIAQAVSAGLCYVYMMKRFDILRTTPAERKYDGALARTLLYIGVPMGLQFSITAIGSIMLQSANNALGTACVAAFTAAMRIKMFFMTPLESLGIAMATYSGQNYGAGKPERIWQGVKAAALMMIIYWAFTFVVLMLGARTFALLFVEATETEILNDTALFLHISVSFFPVLGLLCILRYTIQGAGFTNLAMLSGVSEMVARILVSVFAVPVFGYLAVCFGDPTAWIFAVAFLVPAFSYVYRKIKRIRNNKEELEGVKELKADALS